MGPRPRLILLISTLATIIFLVVVGVLQHRIEITSVALALIAYLGWLTKGLLDIKDDPP